MRFVYRRDPPEDALPKLTSQVVQFEDLPATLPEGVRQVKPAARKREVAIRQAHIKLRYRAY
jgi:hypothetical protein